MIKRLAWPVLVLALVPAAGFSAAPASAETTGSQPAAPANTGPAVAGVASDARAGAGPAATSAIPPATPAAAAAAAAKAPAGAAADNPATASLAPEQEFTPSPAELALRVIAARQQTLLAKAGKEDEAHLDTEQFRTDAQQLANEYDDFLKRNPDYAPGYAAYAVLLGKMDMRKQSAALLLKANDLFGREAKAGGATTPAFARTWALVKNQLGNYIAEEGQPLEAVNYFLAAIELVPSEPLYHYQLGTLLHEARDDFVKSGEWTRAAVDRSMHQAFQHAAELAPDRIEFTYRYAESFYDLENPDWDGALQAWGALEEKAGTDTERQTMRLHAANILIMQQKFDHARALLATVTEPALQPPRQKLLAKLPVESPPAKYGAGGQLGEGGAR